MWVKDNSIADLTKVSVSGHLPTLNAGLYEGTFIGAANDEGGVQWITFSCSAGVHVEQSNLNVSKIPEGTRVLVLIEALGGAGLKLKGDKFKLVLGEEDLTKWTDLNEIYRYVKEHNVKLAGPRLMSISEVTGG